MATTLGYGGSHNSFTQGDLNMLAALTGDRSLAHAVGSSSPPPHGDGCSCDQPHAHSPPASAGSKKKMSDRRPPVDPLMVAAASAAGPDVTRNHYLHDFFPQQRPTLAFASCDEVPSATKARVRMVSQQAPRSVRLANEKAQRKLEHAQQRIAEQRQKTLAINAHTLEGAVPLPAPILPLAGPAAPSSSEPQPQPQADNSNVVNSLRQQPEGPHPSIAPAVKDFAAQPAATSAGSASAAVNGGGANALPPLEIKCQVRTRIPTPHGHIFLYLYTNNHDSKEHLAFVADQAQMDAQPGEVGPRTQPFLRSASLDAVWHDDESEMERIVRGAYVGRLSATTVNPSKPSGPAVSRRGSASSVASSSGSAGSVDEREPPLVRIHSECFTGEVIGSQRCDCGEQLDEAFRLISRARRGIVVYLRQEGRGIGLLEKMRAYNLQDLGHDTVTANLMLGHGADMRTYGIAGAILRDLSVPEVKLLTNNPDKIQQIEREGVTVIERVAMVPRAWLMKSSKRPAGQTKGKRPARHTMSGANLLQLATEKIMQTAASAASGTEGDDGYTEEEGEVLDDDTSEVSGFSEDEDESAESHALRHSGVGMIGASTTRSPELEKYLRTKIERMGHMLEAPPPTPIDQSEASTRAATPAPSGRSQTANGKQQQQQPGQHQHKRPHHSQRRTTSTQSGVHPLASSVTSLAEAEAEEGEEARCGSDCAECEDGSD